MTLAQLINRRRDRFTPLFEPALHAGNTIYMELSAVGADTRIASEAVTDAQIFRRIDAAGAIAGIGGYLERRSVYRDTELFQGDSERCIHIGVDVFMPAGTPIYVPLEGEVQSFANRTLQGDYGPVIILRHQLDGIEFHTLYGHLDAASLDGLRDGKTIEKGARLAAIGQRPGNGNWTPHLHFQLIRDLQGNQGDYPGVVRPDEVEFYRDNCPDPMPLLLR